MHPNSSSETPQLDWSITFPSHADVIRRAPLGGFGGLLEIVRYFGDREVLSNLLTEYARTSALLRLSARQSYEHANGFDKIVLLTTSELKLRVHVWWNKPHSFTENIHNHRWDFAAKVITGQYRFQLFRRMTRGDSLFRYAYRSPSNAESYALLPRGRIAVQCMFDGVVASGDDYILSHSALHRVIVRRDRPTITIVCHGPAVQRQTTVLSPTQLRNSRRLPCTRLTPSDLRGRLTRIVAALR